jgi:hypothetical protein
MRASGRRHSHECGASSPLLDQKISYIEPFCLQKKTKRPIRAIVTAVFDRCLLRDKRKAMARNLREGPSKLFNHQGATMKAAIMNRENDVTSTAPKKAGIKKGPSPFEVEYLRELKEELEIFLKSRNFTTIQEVQVAFAGSDYTGLMQVRGRHGRRMPVRC